MKKEDVLIYACVIICAGIGLAFGQALPGVLIGLGAGYLIKHAVYKDSEK
ncbi:hypothetical protein ACF3MZ_23455 [Paenibacillaceae bacterium WGS1546]